MVKFPPIPGESNESNPESTDEPTFGDDMSRSELQAAIVEYQEWCSENYDEIDVDLDGIPVEISTKMKRTAGKVASQRATGNVKFIRYAMKAYQKWGWDQFAETIRHELIHVHTIQNHKKGGHGRLFKRFVKPLETHQHCETFAEEEAKYLLFCTECDRKVGQRFKRSKIVKQPGSYQGKCCNAPLRVESN